jgi:hypothetical protein
MDTVRIRNVLGTVEAVRVTLLNMEDASAWAGASTIGRSRGGPGILLCNREGGGALVREGDWLVREPDGSFTGCGPACFARRFPGHGAPRDGAREG